MDIDVIKEVKRQCESEIRAIIAMFEKQSGCCVCGIDLIHGQRFGERPSIEDERERITDMICNVVLNLE